MASKSGGKSIIHEIMGGMAKIDSIANARMPADFRKIRRPGPAKPRPPAKPKSY